MKHLGMLLVLCLLIPTLGCHAAPSNPPPDIMVTKTGTWYRADQQLTDDVFGKTIKAPQGALLDLALSENASTGYSWHVSSQPAGAVILVRKTGLGSGSNLPGSGGTAHFLLLVNRAGRSKVTLQYGRWWHNGEREPAKSFIVDATP